MSMGGMTDSVGSYEPAKAPKAPRRTSDKVSRKVYSLSNRKKMARRNSTTTTLLSGRSTPYRAGTGTPTTSTASMLLGATP